MNRLLVLASVGAMILAAPLSAVGGNAKAPGVAKGAADQQAVQRADNRAAGQGSSPQQMQVGKDLVETVSTCPDGQTAPGHSATAPGSPFNPDGKSNHSPKSNYQNGCHEQPASP